MSAITNARIIPISHTHLNSRDIMRIALLLTIPIYARSYLFSSVIAALGHVLLIGLIGVCVVRISRGIVGLDLIWDIIYGLIICSFPSWSTSLLKVLWVGPGIKGWRREIVYWAFVARRLTYLLPEPYGNDIEVRTIEIALTVTSIGVLNRAGSYGGICR
jgi:hypothetical protein